MSCREFRGPVLDGTEHWTSQVQGRTCPVSGSRSEGIVNLAGTSHLHNLKLHSQRQSRRLDVADQLSGAYEAGIRQDGHSGDVWNRVLEELQRFAR